MIHHHQDDHPDHDNCDDYDHHDDHDHDGGSDPDPDYQFIVIVMILKQITQYLINSNVFCSLNIIWRMLLFIVHHIFMRISTF